ncbi:MAG: glycosyltransferase family 2 protein [Bacteroidales bacterium]|nr:glycosyltransferase family 2 protein [Bacteroidales bacterium]
MPRLSVIIPVYNSEQYLSECLLSVCRQTLSDIEIICVNDCSTDGSRKILEDFAAADSRVRILDAPVNQGPSAARNAGIEAAGGDYIGFLDSDDWIDEDFFSLMVEKATEKDSDILISTNVVREFGSGPKPYTWLSFPESTPEGEWITPVFCANYAFSLSALHLYNTSFLKSSGVRYPTEYKIHEDDFFHRVISLKTDRIYVFHGSRYHYRYLSSSLIESRTNHNAHSLALFKALKQYYGDRILEKSFEMKLFGKMLFSNIETPESFADVKNYLISLSDYFEKSGVWPSDFDRYCIKAILESEDHQECMKRIGTDPWVKYQTIERIKRNMSIKVSVIIPEYNVEKYVGKCIQSICDQTFHDIEIIIVDDCSTDGSLKISKQYATQDNRIKVIALEKNQGVSAARNAGIAVAKGEYIYFIDSDDWIDTNYIEVMVSEIEKHKVDLLVNTSFVNEYDDPNRKEYSNFTFFNPEGETLPAVTVANRFPPTVAMRLFRKSLITKYNILFPDVLSGEDVFFTYACDLAAGKEYVFKGPYYHYYQRTGSAMRMSFRGYYYIECFKLLYDFLNKYNLPYEGLKMFYVESLILDTEDKFTFTRNYLLEVRDLVYKNIDLYNEQELFLMKVVEEISDFDTFKSRMNPNIALSFLRYRMTKKI